MTKLSLILLVALNFTMVACSDNNEFSNKDTLSKLDNGELTEQEVAALEPEEETVDQVLRQMSEEMDEDVKEPIEDVMKIENEDLKKIYACKNPLVERDDKYVLWKEAAQKQQKKRVPIKRPIVRTGDGSDLKSKYGVVKSGLLAKASVDENEESEVDEEMKEVEVKIRKCKRNRMRKITAKNEKELKGLKEELMKLKKIKMARIMKNKKVKKTRRPSSLPPKKGVKKYMICHVPKGNEDNPKTLCLPSSALKAHVMGLGMNNGSKGYMGPCTK